MAEKRKTKKRIVSFDIARALAIFLVVLCHATEAIYTRDMLINNHSIVIRTITFTLGRVGVPLFLFLTGALVLKKQIEDDNDVLTFYKKSLLPLVVVNIAWVLIYNMFFLLSGEGGEVTIDNIVREIFLVKVVPITNMWYMPMIIGLYVGIPFVAKIVKVFSKKGMLLSLLVVFAFYYLIPFINDIMSICGVEEKWLLSIPVDLSFLGGVYGLYILLGYLITNEKKCKIKTVWFLIAVLFSLGICCVIQFISRGEGSHYIYNIWYNSPFLLVCSACLFVVLNRINFEWINKKVLGVITFISRASLGIFFLHTIIQWVLLPHILALNVMVPAKLLALSVLNFVICVVVCHGLSKIKIIAKWVLLVK